MISYYTIKSDEDANAILKRIYDRFPGVDFGLVAPPVKLMGSAKILALKIKESNHIIKIDGPGFLIDKLYERFLFGDEMLDAPEE